MDKELKQQIEAVLSRQIEWLTLELKRFIVENGLKGKLLSACSSNPSDVFSAYVSYIPHSDPAEESIVLSLTPSINPQLKNMDFIVDIYWSDGSQIQDLIERKGIDLDKAALQIDSIIEQSKFDVLSQMKKQISFDRPSYYHKD